MDYVDRLTQLRIDRDFNQQDIAELLEVKQSTISKYEKRRSLYRVEDIIKLCNFYGVSSDYILGIKKGLDYPER